MKRTGLTDAERRREIQEIRAELDARDLGIEPESTPVELRHMCIDDECEYRESKRE